MRFSQARNQLEGNQLEGNQLEGNQPESNQLEGNQLEGNQLEGNQPQRQIELMMNLRAEKYPLRGNLHDKRITLFWLL